MLFNSYEFLLLFLPVCWTAYVALARLRGQRPAIAWLALCSMAFYGWWNVAYVWLMTASILFNYGAGLALASRHRHRLLLTAAVTANLLLLGYYKYTDFFISNINQLTDSHWPLHNIVLPLGISFFTFTQIAYLVDVYRGEVREYRIGDYFLFVTYFPHLIAGPIIHHKEMMPQFSLRAADVITARNVCAGLVLFIIGLVKKIGLADRIVEYATPVFAAAEQGATLTLLEAWGGALAYTLQLYFDFSGYADMALGLSLLFGIRLPLNFDSPYKSTNIIDFWRRWHMTLSRFLRDYLYIGLGGNRKGPVRRYLNLLITMLLGGLWHGAGWPFVVWGALHGAYLCINHGWRALWPARATAQPSFAATLGYGALTFIAVVIAWVFFRAESLDGALRILTGMAGCNGVSLPLKYADKWANVAPHLTQFGVVFDDNLFKGGKQVTQTLWMLLLVWLLPNSQTLLRHYDVTVSSFSAHSRLEFRPSVVTLLLCFAGFAYGFSHLAELSEFLYFRF